MLVLVVVAVPLLVALEVTILRLLVALAPITPVATVELERRVVALLQMGVLEYTLVVVVVQ